MSYCRWSTDDFQCDIYAYQSAQGYEIHVARSRCSKPYPIERMLNKSIEEVTKDMDETAPMVDINGPYDGRSFLEPDLRSFHARMMQLREAGYRFPGAVLSEVLGEIAEANAAKEQEGDRDEA